MIKEEAEAKLALMPLLVAVAVAYVNNPEAEPEVYDPMLRFHYENDPGPGETSIDIPLNHSSQNLMGVVNNLPLNSGDRPLCKAIMLGDWRGPVT